MSSESRSTLQRKLDEYLENQEVKSRLVQFFEILAKIDDRERIVRSPNSKIQNSEEINND